MTRYRRPMCWNDAVPHLLLRPRTAASVIAVVLGFAVAAAGCGGGDDTQSGTAAGGGTAPAIQSAAEKKKVDSIKAYNTAFTQCQRIGLAALRANYQRKGKNGKPLGPGLVAQVYVSQTTFFHPYEQKAIRGCEAGLRH